MVPPRIPLLLLSLALPLQSLAQQIEGRVVHVSPEEIVLDLGRTHGLRPGVSVDVLRRLVVTHPITGEAVEDRFPIGPLRPAEIGERLSIVRDARKLSRKPQPGDYVVFGQPAPQAPQAPQTPQTPQAAPEAPSAPPDRAALEAVLVDSLGKQPEDRAQAYVAWLERFPDSPHAMAVAHEIEVLRRLSVAPEPQAVPDAPRPPVALHQRPTTLRTDQPLQLAVGFAPGEPIDRVRVHLRRDPTAPWETLELAPDGDAYWRIKVPAEWTGKPGTLEYVLETLHAGVAHPVVARFSRPVPVTLTEPPPLERPARQSQLASDLRFVDFNTGGEAKDRYLRFETSFAYTLDWEAIRRVRVGIGLIDGEGGPTEAITADPASVRSSSVNYAFAEGELAVNDLLGVAARLYAGNHHQTDDGRSTSMTGFEARLRLGYEDGTRLTLGGSLLDVLGAQASLHLDLEAIPWLPLRTGVVVTNLPVDADLGVQLEAQVGWRVNRLLTLRALTGWNARTINHYGFTAGGGLTLDW